MKDWLWRLIFRKIFHKQLEDEIQIFLCGEQENTNQLLGDNRNLIAEREALQKALDENRIIGAKGPFFIDEDGNQYKM